MGLTPRQAEILAFISEYTDNRGYAPTLQEIGGKFGLSSVAPSISTSAIWWTRVIWKEAAETPAGTWRSLAGAMARESWRGFPCWGPSRRACP